MYLLFLLVMLLSAYYLLVAFSLTCDAEDYFPETPAGEMSYQDCKKYEYDSDNVFVPQWGYRVKYCSNSESPIWVNMLDTCTAQKKLIHPPYGYEYVDYQFEVGVLSVTQKTGHWLQRPGVHREAQVRGPHCPVQQDESLCH